MKTIRPSYSKLKKLKQAPAMVLVQQEESNAMNEGTAFHCAVLQPEKFKTDYFIFDDSRIIEEIGGGNPRATNKYKEWKNSLPTTDKIIISKELADNFNTARDKVMADPFIKYLLKNAVLEQKFTFLKDVMGDKIEVSLIPDAVNVDKKVIIDLKTCQSAKPIRFRNDAAKYDYHLQAGIYIEGCCDKYGGTPEEWDYYIIAVELNEPHLYMTYQADSEFVSAGRMEFDVLMMLWKDCTEKGFNRGYQVFTKTDEQHPELRIEKLNLPQWKFYENIDFY
jgi:hypothetical protein